MKEFYFTLREKISKHVIVAFVISYSLFVGLISWVDSNFSIPIIILLILFWGLFLFRKKKFLPPLYYSFTLFIFFNPLLDFALTNFSLLSKSIVFIILIASYKKFIYFNSKIILLANCLFITFIIFCTLIHPNYKTKKETSNLTKFVIEKIKKGESVDVILLDAYPNFDFVRDSFKVQSKLQTYINKNNFVTLPNQTYSTKTAVSVAQLFLNTKIFPADYQFELKDRIAYYHDLVEKSEIQHICKEKSFDFQFLSPTNHTFQPNAWKLYWNFSNSRYFGLLNKFINQTAKFDFFVNQYHWNSIFTFDQQYQFNQIDLYNQKLKERINKSNSRKQFNFYHFLTLHKYNPLNPQNAFKRDLIEADNLGIKLIEQLQQKRKSNIIILSDHGNRTMIKNIENQKKGILAIKEL